MSNFSKSTIYQIYTKSFQDSNGDGLGDIRGITQRLDYIKGLGVDYVWITPFFKSPMRDNGYDVADYFSINPMFGTMEDVNELIAEAKKRGLGLIFDMVFNHTSTEHIWFQRALAGEQKYMDYYFFQDGTPDAPPTNWVSKFGGNAWEYVPHLKKWYLHLFDRTQADLNWENPKVREELKEIIRFWKEKGVKGFRFDVVNLISKPEQFTDDYEGDGRSFYTDGRHVHEYLKELVKDTGIENMVTVGEMSSTSLKNCIRYTNPEEKEFSMVFNFHHLKVDYKDGEKWELQDVDCRKLKDLFTAWQLGMQKEGGWNALFWCNHDQPRAVSRYGNDTHYWKESAKMLATFSCLMQGTPYIFQGEELGMTNAGYTDISQYRDVESINYYKILLENGKSVSQAMEILAARSRDNGRTPMQWNAGAYAGFSETKPWIDIPENHSYINVEEEEKDPDSILQYYKKLVQIRKDYPVVSDGRIEFLYDEEDTVFVYRRYLEDDDSELYVFNNMREEPISLKLPFHADCLEHLIGNYETPCIRDGILYLRPYETAVWIK